MTATGEIENATVDQRTAVVAAAKKPVKERKPKAPKEKKPQTAKTASHPPYFQMIKEALLALNEKGGLSPYAIAKYMEEKHKAVLPSNFRKILGLQLKNSAAKGYLIKVKASYKLSVLGMTKAGKTDAMKKQPKQTKPAIAKAAKKSEAVKKTKKAAPAKAKQPKSIKSPAAKKAKKAAA